MKKLITLLSLFFVLSGFVKAQDVEGFHAGLNIGGNNTWILHQYVYDSTSLEHDFKATFGFSGGLALGYNFSHGMGIQTEVYYSSQGQNYEERDYGFGFVVGKSIKLNYIQIPVYFKFTGGEAPAKFFVMVGPQFGLLSSSEIKITTSFGDTSVTDKKHFQSSDISISLGTGVDISVSDNAYISAGMRFSYGLMDINGPDDRKSFTHGTTSYPYKASTNALAGLFVGFHYLFR